MKYTSRNQSVGRTVLAGVIPIRTPYVVGIYTGDICNFRCKYCVQSMKKLDNRQNHDLVKSFMPWETFTMLTDQLMEFPDRIKKVLFSSIGEPLLNKNLSTMIKYLSDRSVADSYEVVSNASLLTPDLSRNLIDAGLSRLCVSIQGMTAEKYKSICGYDVDMDRLIENLRYFYKYSRGKCKLHIKTVDIALDEGEKDQFLDIFGGFCDTIHVDHVIPLFTGVDYDFLQNKDLGLVRDQTYNIKVCSALFYTIYIASNGEVVPCCKTPYPMHYGNICNHKLQDIWNGDIRKNFLKLHLKKLRDKNPVCKDCVVPQTTCFQEDILDDVADEILERM